MSMIQAVPVPTQNELPGGGRTSGLNRVIIVDDESANRRMCRQILEANGMLCAEAPDGKEALQSMGKQPYDLVLLDVDMPEMTGTEVLRQLRRNPPAPHLKIIMMSGRATGDEMARMMRAGADDYLSKPFTVVQLLERVKAALRLKAAQDRSDLLHHGLLTLNHGLEQGLLARDSDLIQARNALVLGLAELVAQRDSETGAHLLRLQHYCRCLAEEAAGLPGFSGQIDPPFIEMLACCAPLHDIGKVGVPDHILLKPGRLTEEERLVMQRHTVVAAETLQKVAQRHGFAVAFLHMAEEIARHHHERFDGKGYPDGLVGDAIPLAARILAFADVYDALRSKRVYKAALSHAEAMRVMVEEDVGHFDPALLAVFRQCALHFERLFEELADKR
jgi:response regulator RpfG family c-di-GMP phosphodiesterase